MLVNELIQTSLIRPNISDLQGTPLLALYRSVEYNRSYGIGREGLGKY
jgi:hypothetical protein